MERTAGIVAVAFGVAVLAAGCTRTSDGSIEFVRPSLGGLLNFGEAGTASIVPSRTLPPPASEPAPARNATAGPPTTLPQTASEPAPTHVAAARPSAKPTLTVASIRIAEDPPFKSAASGRRLSCTNSRTAAGRIHVVCR